MPADFACNDPISSFSCLISSNSKLHGTPEKLGISLEP